MGNKSTKILTFSDAESRCISIALINSFFCRYLFIFLGDKLELKRLKSLFDAVATTPSPEEHSRSQRKNANTNSNNNSFMPMPQNSSTEKPGVEVLKQNNN